MFCGSRCLRTKGTCVFCAGPEAHGRKEPTYSAGSKAHGRDELLCSVLSGVHEALRRKEPFCSVGPEEASSFGPAGLVRSSSCSFLLPPILPFILIPAINVPCWGDFR